MMLMVLERFFGDEDDEIFVRLLIFLMVGNLRRFEGWCEIENDGDEIESVK
jgi:hypothetical protein